MNTLSRFAVGLIASLPFPHPLPASPGRQALLDKGFSPSWVDQLTERGEVRRYTGEELRYIGMPIGGLYAGQVYLSGDGRLWYWDVFNKRVMSPGGPGDTYYNRPMLPADYPGVRQGFWLEDDGVRIPLDATGFDEITFTGTYPIAEVAFSNPAENLKVTLTAYSPFIPLNDRDSSIPATLLSYEITHTGTGAREVRLGGWLENPTHRVHRGKGVVEPKVKSIRGGKAVVLGGTVATSSGVLREDILLEDFENDYGFWRVEGDAFGDKPFVQTDRKPWQPLGGQGGTALANSHNSYLRDNSRACDALAGRLVSNPFPLERDFLVFKIGGGNHPGKTGFRLRVDGEIVAEATGSNRVRLEKSSFHIAEYAGKTGVIEIIDDATGSWGHILVDDIFLTDDPAAGAGNPAEANDAGTFALALLEGEIDPRAGTVDPAKAAILTKPVKLAPGERTTVTFAIAWHMPNIHNGERALWALKEMRQQRHYYAGFYRNAGEVAADLIDRHESLRDQTRAWVDTWYDSNLPHWFLGRTLFNVSTLATTSAHRFHHPENERLDGRPYFWEGVYLGDGTCTHVTHYEQAMGRLFPQAGRDQRRAADYGAGWDDELGYIRYRAEFGYGHHFGIPHAADGHAGTLLRTYREHTTSADDRFLRAEWPKVKRAMRFMIDQDAGRGFFEGRVPGEDKNSEPDGLLTGPQYNTLDRYWFGRIPWISGLYQAALRATAEMATEMGDPEFAATCSEIADRGHLNLTADLFSEEYGYYVQKGHEGKNAINVNIGSHVDQVLGQYWAGQVGLPRVFPEAQTRSALAKLFEHNFYRHVGDYRKDAFVKAARFYADDDEAGLFMCTFPNGGAEASINEAGVIGGYFSECMDGFAYSAASAMIQDGLVIEGLAICRSIDDRYAGAPLRRNPFNEVEYGNHYTRSMASYAPFIALCGFEYHGPRGEIGFAPRLHPEDFKAPFTAAEGWGTFRQTANEGGLEADIALNHGRLKLNQVKLATRGSRVAVRLNGASRPASLVRDGEAALVRLHSPVRLTTGDRLVIRVW